MGENLKLFLASLLMIVLVMVHTLYSNEKTLFTDDSENELCDARGHGFLEIPNDWSKISTSRLVDNKDSSYIVSYEGIATSYKCSRCDKTKTIFEDSLVNVIWRNKNICVKKK